MTRTITLIDEEEHIDEIQPNANKITGQKGEKPDIPFTFSVPKTCEELDELFENRGAKEKALITERMIKCNHPQFGNDNKAQLENLFKFLLQHIHDCASNVEESDENNQDNLKAFNVLTPFLFDLAKFSPQSSGEAVRSVLQEKFEEYAKTPRSYPGLDAVSILNTTLSLYIG